MKNAGWEKTPPLFHFTMSLYNVLKHGIFGFCEESLWGLSLDIEC